MRDHGTCDRENCGFSHDKELVKKARIAAGIDVSAFSAKPKGGGRANGGAPKGGGRGGKGDGGSRAERPRSSSRMIREP